MTIGANIALAAGLFVGTVLALELGRRLGLRRLQQEGEAGYVFGTIDGAVFGLLALLVAFTFQGAAERFNARRHLMGEEANHISTAYERLELLDPPARENVKERMRQYLDARLRTFALLPDVNAARAEFAHSIVMQHDIWLESVAAASAQQPFVPILLLPALNVAFDTATTQLVLSETHPPKTIYAMLIALVLCSAVLAGMSVAHTQASSLLHFIGYGVIMAVALFIIADLEFPRLGLIRINDADHVLVELRARMH